MTIRALFSADFTQFETAVSKAEMRLTDFSAGADRAQSSLNKMTDQFSGKRVVQEATVMAQAVADLGGTSILTAKELQSMGAKATEAVAKMRALGIEPPANLLKIADASKAVTKEQNNIFSSVTKVAGALGIAFSVQSILQFTSAVFDNADALVKMSDRTGIGTEALGKLQAVADASGNTIEEITQGINKMQKNLAGGDQSAVSAIKEMGLSLSKLTSMKPEDQFTAIAGAIAKIQDPAKQTQLAMEVFGKAGAELLPTLKADILGVGNAATVMSDETNKALDAAGDAWKAFKRNAMNAAGEAFGFIIEQNRAADLETQRMIERLKDVTHVLEKLPDISKIAHPALAINGPLSVAGPSAELLDFLDHHATLLLKKDEELLAAQKKLADEAKKTAEAARKYTEEIVKQAESTEQLKFKTLSLGDALHSIGGSQFTPSIKDIGNTSLRSASDVGTLAGSVEDLERQGKFTEATLQKMGMTIGILPNVTSQFGTSIEEARTETEDWHGELDDLARSLTQFAQISGDSFGGVVKDIATVVSAFNLAVKSAEQFKSSTSAAGKALALIGGASAVAQGTAQGSTTTRVIGGALSGAATGAAVGSAVPVAGTIIGAIVGGAIGWWRGRQADKQFKELRDTFVKESGGIDALQAHAASAGVSLDALFNAKHAKDYNIAIDAVNKGLADFDTKTARVNDGVDMLSKAWHDAGEYIPSDIQGMVDEMLTMNGLTADQQTLLGEMSSAAEPNFKKLTALAADYGITLDGLGPKFQQADISASAQQIFKDFDALQKAGADVGGVLSGMADEIQALIDNSKRFGAAIPDNMKPLIDNLIKAGRLTDENGVALTDVSQINFGATPLDRSTSAIVDAVHELRDALLGLPDNAARAAQGVQNAFNGLQINPSVGNPNTDLGFNDPGVPGFAGGTRGRLLNFGTGTLAMLHGRERVQTASEVAQSDAMSAGLGGLQDSIDAMNRYLTQDFARETSRLVKQRVA